MKNVTRLVVESFLAGEGRSISTTATNGKILTYHGNVIARKTDSGEIQASLAGWGSVSTRAKLNALCTLAGCGKGFTQRKGVQFYGESPVDVNAWVTLGKPAAAASEVRGRLEYLREQLRSECISYEELGELQGLADHIDRGDVELLEAAGVPEFPE